MKESAAKSKKDASGSEKCTKDRCCEKIAIAGVRDSIKINSHQNDAIETNSDVGEIGPSVCRSSNQAIQSHSLGISTAPQITGLSPV